MRERAREETEACEETTKKLQWQEDQESSIIRMVEKRMFKGK